MENWLPVVGYEGAYEVSDLGRVRSLTRLDARGRRRYREERSQERRVKNREYMRLRRARGKAA